MSSSKRGSVHHRSVVLVDKFAVQIEHEHNDVLPTDNSDGRGGGGGDADFDGRMDERNKQSEPSREPDVLPFVQ